jgi:hypothetical protein
MDSPSAQSPAESQGLGTYRVVRALCVPLFFVPILYVLFTAVARFSEQAAGPLFVLFMIVGICSPVLAVVGLIVGVIAGSRGRLSDAVNRKMWRLCLATLGLLVVLYAMGR